MGAMVSAVALGDRHQFSKHGAGSLLLVEGRGVQGDSHYGATVQHRSRAKIDPTLPNLRQVHLIHAELFDELADKDFAIGPGDLGENITTRGVDLLALPTGALLQIGDEVALEVTGLRNPCRQIEAFMPGLLAAVLDKRADGGIIRKTGVMSVVRSGGAVQPGDPITIVLPQPPLVPLDVV